MFNKFVLATAIVGSVLATGASASAADYARDTTAPPPSRVAPISDFSGSEPPGYSAYVLQCSGHAVCDSLQKFCANVGGEYYVHSDPKVIKGACIKN